jgi:hypothetical protein
LFTRIRCNAHTPRFGFLRLLWRHGELSTVVFDSLKTAYGSTCKQSTLLWRTAHFGGSGSAPCPIALRRFFGLERTSSKVWSKDHLLWICHTGTRKIIANFLVAVNDKSY